MHREFLYHTVSDHEDILSNASTDEETDEDYRLRLSSRLTDLATLSDQKTLYNDCGHFKRGSDALDRIAKERIWGPSREVGLSVAIYSFGDFCMSDCSFKCDYGIKKTWKKGVFSASTNNTVAETVRTQEGGNEETIHEPLHGIMNNCDSVCEIEKRPNTEGSGLVNSFGRYQCRLKANVDLKWFPFDMQSLSLHVRLLESNAAMVPLEYYELKEQCRQLEWHVYKPCRTYTVDSTGKPLLKFSIIVRRKWEYYVFNMVGVQFMLANLSFIPYAIPLDAFADRSSADLTLLLTTIAFKLYVAGEMPKVAYLTCLDIYVIASFLMQVLIYALHWLAFMFHNGGYEASFFGGAEDQNDIFDSITFYVLLVVWALFNMCFLAAATCHVYSCKRLLVDRPVFD